MFRLIAALVLLSLAGAATADDKDTKMTIIGTWQKDWGDFIGGGATFEFQEQSLKIRSSSGLSSSTSMAAKITVGKDGTVVGKVTYAKGNGNNLWVDQEFRFKWDVKPNGEMVLSDVGLLGGQDGTYYSTMRWRVTQSTPLQAAEVNLGGANPATRRVSAETIRSYRQADAVAIRHAFGIGLPWNEPGAPARGNAPDADWWPNFRVHIYFFPYLLVARPILLPLNRFWPGFLVQEFEKLIGKPLPPQVLELPISKQIDLKRTSSDAGSRAAWALYAGAIGKEDATFLAPLIEIFDKDRNEYVRVEAAYALRRIGAGAKAAVPALTAGLDAPDPRVRLMAAVALARIDKNAASPAIPALTAALKSPDTDTPARVLVAQALGALGVPDGVAFLVGLLKDKELTVRVSAIQAFGGIGAGAKAAVPSLVRFLTDKDPATRLLVVEALAKVGAGPELAAVVAKTTGGAAVRAAAVRGLGELGAGAADGVPVLLTALDDREKAVAVAASAALVKLGLVAVPELEKALTHKDYIVRAQAARILGGIGPNARSAVPALVANLAHAEWKTRRAAAEALGKVGPAAKDAVGPLTAALKDKDSAVREAAATALGGIGPDAKTAIPALKAATADTYASVAAAAKATLKKLEP